MCGVNGIFAYRADSPRVDRSELALTSEYMRSRGPDGEGSWISDDRSLGIAHRRLAIIDLSAAGAQPMLDPETGNRIAFNGEICNYQVLRAELVAMGHQFQSHSDTEVLLRLYSVHGRDMMMKLRGMFAFAIWDEARRGVLLARDPFGIKPLYIADDGKSLRFASQVRALLAGKGVDTSPEPAGHVGFFLWGNVPEPYTLYKSIRELPAGSSLWVSGGASQEHRFFDIGAEISEPAMRLGRLDPVEVQQRLRSALMESVGRHLVADVPVGLFLSAGQDSAVIAALATEHMRASAKSGSPGGELRSLTLGFSEFANTLYDEVPLADTIARHYGTTHRTRWVVKEEFDALLDHLLDVMDQPSIDGLNTYLVSMSAAQSGLTVAMSGLGGDELFAGYSYFGEIPKMVRALGGLSAFPVIGRGFRRISAPMLKQFTSPKYAGLLEYGGDYASAYLLRRSLFMPWELPEVLDGEMVREGWNTLQTLPALRQTMAGTDNPRLRITALETSWYMRSQLLRDSDWASMAHSLEVRVPLVDVDLFRTVVALVHEGHAASKASMSASASPPLPDAVLHRKKTGFTTPIGSWLMDGRKQPKRSSGYRAWARHIHAELGGA